MIRRACLLLLLCLPTAALAADLAGTWQIQGPINPRCSFTQSGSNLSGACRGAGAEGPLSGTIDGQTVRWTFTRTNFNTGQRIVPVQFSGTLNGQTLSGTMSMNGANPRPFTAQMLPNAGPVQLASAAPAPQPAPQPAAQPAAASAAPSINTAPPRTVFDIDIDGSAIHRQSGLVCPVTVQGWARNGTTMFDKAGYDVSCGYRSPAGSEITIYLSRHPASELQRNFDGARDQIPKTRPNTNPRDDTAAAPKGFDWLKAGFEMREGEVWSDLFLAALPGWHYEARITYKPSDLTAVNAVFADLSANVARTAGRQMAACEAAEAPKRGAQRITDADEIRSYAVSAAAQARAVIAASRGAGQWCPEGNTSGGSTTSDYWRNIAVDAKAPALDRLLGVDNDTHIVIARNEAATQLAAKNGTPRQVYDMLMERKDEIVLLAEFDGRPAAGELLQVLQASQVRIYASVNKATANISFTNLP